jgi:hypothetical protein
MPPLVPQPRIACLHAPESAIQHRARDGVQNLTLQFRLA